MASKFGGLLKWCQNRTKDYSNVSINNFSQSWSNGLAFCAILHHYHPDLVDYASLKPDEAEKNLKLAWDIAENKLGIANYLDIEDILSVTRPEPKTMSMQVYEWYKYFSTIEPNTPFYGGKPTASKATPVSKPSTPSPTLTTKPPTPTTQKSTPVTPKPSTPSTSTPTATKPTWQKPQTTTTSSPAVNTTISISKPTSVSSTTQKPDSDRSALEKEIADLKKELEKAKGLNDTLKKQNENSSADHNKELQKLKDNNKKLETEIDKLKREANSAKPVAATSTLEKTRMEKEIQDLKNQNDKVAKELKDLQSQMQKLDQDKRNLEKEKLALQKESDESKKSASTNKLADQKNADQIKKLEEQVKKLQTDCSTLQKERDQLKVQASKPVTTTTSVSTQNVQSELTKLKNEKQQLEKKLQDREKELQSEVTKIKNEKQQVEKKLQEKEKELLSKPSTPTTSSTNAFGTVKPSDMRASFMRQGSTSSASASSSDKEKDLQNEITKLKTEKQQLEKKFQDKEKELQTEMTKSKNEKQQLEKKLQEREKELSTKSSDVASPSTTVRPSYLNARASSQENNQQAEITKLKNEKQQLEKKLQDREKELQTELTKIKNEKSQLEKNLQQEKSKVSSSSTTTPFSVKPSEIRSATVRPSDLRSQDKEKELQNELTKIKNEKQQLEKKLQDLEKELKQVPTATTVVTKPLPTKPSRSMTSSPSSSPNAASPELERFVIDTAITFAQPAYVEVNKQKLPVAAKVLFQSLTNWNQTSYAKNAIASLQYSIQRHGADLVMMAYWVNSLCHLINMLGAEYKLQSHVTKVMQDSKQLSLLETDNDKFLADRYNALMPTFNLTGTCTPATLISELQSLLDMAYMNIFKTCMIKLEGLIHDTFFDAYDLKNNYDGEENMNKIVEVLDNVYDELRRYNIPQKVCNHFFVNAARMIDTMIFNDIIAFHKRLEPHEGIQIKLNVSFLESWFFENQFFGENALFSVSKQLADVCIIEQDSLATDKGMREAVCPSLSTDQIKYLLAKRKTKDYVKYTSKYQLSFTGYPCPKSKSFVKDVPVFQSEEPSLATKLSLPSKFKHKSIPFL